MGSGCGEGEVRRIVDIACDLGYNVSANIAGQLARCVVQAIRAYSPVFRGNHSS
jgi:hypothetical protein